MTPAATAFASRTVIAFVELLGEAKIDLGDGCSQRCVFHDGLGEVEAEGGFLTGAVLRPPLKPRMLAKFTVLKERAELVKLDTTCIEIAVRRSATDSESPIEPRI